MSSRPSRGLLLSGGGARAAYQAGVLRRLQEASREKSGKVPFEILVGVSAGAINLAALAARAATFAGAVEEITARWRSITTDRVFRTSSSSIFLNAVRWFFDLTLGGALGAREPRGKSLVDTLPLSRLIDELLPPGRIEENVRRGVIDGVAISAMNYDTGKLTTFIEASRDRTLWRRASRTSVHDRIAPQHILASCALPFIFPAVRIGGVYYGDGSIHNTAPLSPVIHLGARRIVAIGVRPMATHARAPAPAPAAAAAMPTPEGPSYPTAARIGGVLLDSIFMDALESDREQMEKVNELVQLVPEKSAGATRLRKIDFLFLGPSRDLGGMAHEHRDELPRAIRYMLGGLGADDATGGELVSYLLFESGYCGALMDLGYRDAGERLDEIEEFLWGG